MADVIIPTLYEFVLSDTMLPNQTVTREVAEKLFTFFKDNPLFRWADVHNNCEARAEAICVLLDEWQIPSYKGWVFSGAFLKNHIGGLKQSWNYHVAALLPVLEDGMVTCYMIDPATSSTLQTLYNWAASVTDYPHSYHMIKLPEYYIFPHGKILKYNWHKRNQQNRKWMLQGLAGINGLSGTGKAQLIFSKARVKATGISFLKLMRQRAVLW